MCSSQNITFQLNMSMSKSIFKLEMMCYEKQRRLHKDDYPRFSLCVPRIAYFISLKDAEDVILDWVNDPLSENIYCFRIVEYPIGIVLDWGSENISLRTYDQFGNKLDERLYQTLYITTNHKSEYKGRPDEKIKYCPGDVVEYNRELYVIARFMTPLSKREWTGCDESDDGYIAYLVDENADEIIFDKDGYVMLNHSHPQCTEIFPPRFPISAKIQRRIDNLREYIKNSK